MFGSALKIGTLVLLFVVSYTSADCQYPYDACPGMCGIGDIVTLTCCLAGTICPEDCNNCITTACCVSFVMTIFRRPCGSACL
uniref:Uncharacterized protein n=1 Tax=Acrobeloides nanus TaxID=290746 RepID=A0A914E8W1_9BILA